MKNDLFTVPRDQAATIKKEQLSGLLLTSEIIRTWVTPEFASFVLTHNTGNRPIRQPYVRRYASDMKNGLWNFNGETISFSKDGMLVNGQHRLSACVKSGCPFETVLIFGVEPSAFVTMDDGAKRTGADALAIKGMPSSKQAAAIVRWLHLLKQKRVTSRATLTNSEIIEVFETLDHSLMDAAIKSWRKAAKSEMGKAPPVGLYGSLFYAFTEADPGFASVFFSGWEQGHSLGGKLAALKKAREAILKARAESHGRIHEVYFMFCIVTAWNLARSGRAGTSTSFIWDGKSFPEIQGLNW